MDREKQEKKRRIIRRPSSRAHMDMCPRTRNSAPPRVVRKHCSCTLRRNYHMLLDTSSTISTVSPPPPEDLIHKSIWTAVEESMIQVVLLRTGSENRLDTYIMIFLSAWVIFLSIALVRNTIIDMSS